MAAGGDAPEDAAFRRYREARLGQFAEYVVFCSLPRARQCVSRQPKCERRLADAARPGQQQRMRQLSAVGQTPQSGFGSLMADEVGIRARRRRGCFRHTSATLSRVLTAATMARWTTATSPDAS